MGYNMVICTLFVLQNIISPVFSLVCSENDICYGSFAYCCGNECCYNRVYTLWWFWLIWVFVTIGIVSCCFACFRRRRLSTVPYYLVHDNRNATRYGTVVANPATQNQLPPAYPATQYQPPPAYPATQHQPPPAYPATQHQITPTAPAQKYNPQFPHYQ